MRAIPIVFNNDLLLKVRGDQKSFRGLFQRHLSAVDFSNILLCCRPMLKKDADATHPTLYFLISGGKKVLGVMRPHKPRCKHANQDMPLRMLQYNITKFLYFGSIRRVFIYDIVGSPFRVLFSQILEKLIPVILGLIRYLAN